MEACEGFDWKHLGHIEIPRSSARIEISLSHLKASYSTCSVGGQCRPLYAVQALQVAVGGGALSVKVFIREL